MDPKYPKTLYDTYVSHMKQRQGGNEKYDLTSQK